MAKKGELQAKSGTVARSGSGSRVVFSGIQPSGNLHIGNYIGAIAQWVLLQNPKSQTLNTKQFQNSNLENSNLFRDSDLEISASKNQSELIFCIVDLHAITVPQNPKVLREKILELSALYLACGIDPEKSKIFIQSENPDHSYLAWIFDCFLPTGWMARMTQFKDKAQKQSDATTMGLFNYPALMAADILLYNTDLVPVGEDQTQHVELARDIAEKINNKFSNIFKLPKTFNEIRANRIMSLSDPLKKMSKSDADPSGTINLLDSEEEIRKKIKHAVTDSGDKIAAGVDKPALTNLLTIYSSFSGLSVAQITDKYTSGGYAKFKEDLADVVVQALKPIQEKYHEIRKDETYLNKVLDEGLKFASERSSKKILQVKEAMGLGRV